MEVSVKEDLLLLWILRAHAKVMKAGILLSNDSIQTFWHIVPTDLFNLTHWTFKYARPQCNCIYLPYSFSSFLHTVRNNMDRLPPTLLTLSSIPMVTLDHQWGAAVIPATLLPVNDHSLNRRINALLPLWFISCFIYTHKSSADNVLNLLGPAASFWRPQLNISSRLRSAHHY